jgi:hypothetical protein
MCAQPASVLLVGYAKLPEDTAAHALYGTVGVAMEVDANTGLVLAAACTMVPGLASEFVGRILKGVTLPDELEAALVELQERYLGPAQSAIIAAVRAANDRWESWRSERG